MIDQYIAIYKDWLPAKCKRENIPQILWMAPPSHKFFLDNKNEKRAKFTNALSAIVALHVNTSMLRLMKFWDHNDSNLFLEEQYHYTCEGLNMYWKSVDAAIKFWFIALSKKIEKNKKKPQDQESGTNQSTKVYEEAGCQKMDTIPRYQAKKPNFENRAKSHTNYDKHYDRKSFSSYDQHDHYNKYRWHRDDYYKSNRRLSYC